MGRTITVVNLSTVVSPEDFQSGVAACHDQVDQDFYQDWGLHADVGPAASDPGKGERILIFDNTDQQGALGYHSVNAGLEPYGKVFARDAQDAGFSWTEVLSHEIIEELADPYINLAALGNLGGRLTLFAMEPADPVENDSYLKSGRKVSNYVLPSWFQPAFYGGVTDRMGLLNTPFTLRPGGYAIVSQRLGHWAQIFGEQASREGQCAAHSTRFLKRAAVAGTVLSPTGGDIPAALAVPPQVWQVLLQLLIRYGPEVLKLLADLLEKGALPSGPANGSSPAGGARPGRRHPA